MAGPSGAGSVAHYLKTTRSARTSAQREIRAAIRRESAKSGRLDHDRASFECFSLCMACGYLVEPAMADPMRSDPTMAKPNHCPSCGQRELADLRDTANLDALCELESSDVGVGVGRRYARMLAVAAGVASLAALAAVMTLGDGGDVGQAGLALAPMSLISLPMLLSLGTGVGQRRRQMPRRWRLAQAGRDYGKRPHEPVRGKARAETELLRAPLSGRLCLAYELGVRDDDDADGDLNSWRLLEQDNVGFAVDEIVIARGAALLQLPRRQTCAGLLMSSDEATRVAMRMRGLPEAEVVHVYETVVLAGDELAVGRRHSDGPMLVTR